MVVPGLLPQSNIASHEDDQSQLALQLFNEGLKELNLTRSSMQPIVLSHSDVPGQKKLSESIAERWKNVLGVKVELSGCGWNVFFSNLVRRQYQIGGCIWFALFHDPIYNLEFFKDPVSRYNTPQWQNDRYVKLLDKADQEIDTEKRLAYLHDAEKLLLDEMPVIPLYVNNYRFMMRDNIKGLYLSELGDVDFKWTSIEAPASMHLASR